VLTRIGDPEFEHICLELGLEETIIPTRAIGRVLFDVAEGRDVLEMTTMLRDVARVFSFVLHIEGTITVDELKLPELSRVICFYRNGQFCIPDDATKLRDDDEVVLITHVDNLKTLEDHWITPAGSR
jgi:trk system potassium uptake protein TrkA